MAWCRRYCGESRDAIRTLWFYKDTTSARGLGDACCWAAAPKGTSILWPNNAAAAFCTAVWPAVRLSVYLWHTHTEGSSTADYSDCHWEEQCLVTTSAYSHQNSRKAHIQTAKPPSSSPTIKTETHQRKHMPCSLDWQVYSFLPFPQKTAIALCFSNAHALVPFTPQTRNQLYGVS